MTSPRRPNSPETLSQNERASGVVHVVRQVPLRLGAHVLCVRPSDRVPINDGCDPPLPRLLHVCPELLQNAPLIAPPKTRMNTQAHQSHAPAIRKQPVIRSGPPSSAEYDIANGYPAKCDFAP